MRRALVAVVLALAVASAPAGSAAAPLAQEEPAGCPQETSCPAYALHAERWPAAADGRVVIPYAVNPTASVFVDRQDVVPAVRAAAEVWMRANPRIELRYQGLTDAQPGVEDGRNVIGFGPEAPFALASAPTWSRSGVLHEADIVVNATVFTSWQQCEQRDGGCSGAQDPEDLPFETRFSEFQSIVTHELGHWLSLSHPLARDFGDVSRMTMDGTHEVDRGLEYQTLALGDVLGVRAAYPCGRCEQEQPPVVFTP